MEAALVHNENSSILDSIDFGESIPALPAGVPELLADLTNDEIGFRDLTDKLAMFPSITSRLIFLANSSWSSPVVPIDSLDLACSKLGLTVIRTVSLALSIASPFNPAKCQGFNSRKFWLSALITAEGAKQLAALSPKLRANQYAATHTAGVLHNIGLLWLADNYPDELACVFHNADALPNENFRDEVYATFGLNYTDINGTLAEKWLFPDNLRVALSQHNSFDYSGENCIMAQLIGISSRLADQVIAGAGMDEEFRLEDPRIQLAALSDKHILTVKDFLYEQFESLSDLVDVFLSVR